MCALMPVNALYKRKSTITHHRAQNMHIEELKLRICIQNINYINAMFLYLFPPSEPN